MDDNEKALNILAGKEPFPCSNCREILYYDVGMKWLGEFIVFTCEKCAWQNVWIKTENTYVCNLGRREDFL